MDVFGEAYESSLEETISNFQKDMHPEREIEIWEDIAKVYKIYTDRNPSFGLEEKKDVYRVALDATSGFVAFDVVKKLTKEQLREIIKLSDSFVSR